jgi:hypothetical protein
MMEGQQASLVHEVLDAADGRASHTVLASHVGTIALSVEACVLFCMYLDRRHNEYQARHRRHPTLDGTSRRLLSWMAA